MGGDAVSVKFCEDCKWVWVDKNDAERNGYLFAMCGHPKADSESLVSPNNRPQSYCSIERKFGRFFGCGPRGNRWEPKA